jgi:drug/metabolite transporter (DMT)-like permease
MADSRSPRHWRGVLILLFVTALWGTTFVVIKQAVGTMSPSVLILGRFGLAAVVLTPFALRARGRPVWFAGFQLGLWLWLGYVTQAQGLVYTTASRSAFITAVSVVLVPVVAGLLGRRFGWPTWASAGLAFAGVALLSYDGTPPNIGDAWTLVTAITYAAYIVRLEAYAHRFKPMELTATQIWGVVPFALAWVAVDTWAGSVSWSLGAAGPWAAVVYLALVATVLTTWLMTVGQREVIAPEAAVIYSTEPLWASLFAFVLLGERFGPRGVVGAGLILTALIVSQIPELSRNAMPRGEAPPSDRSS